jgi:hypothetical protein
LKLLATFKPHTVSVDIDAATIGVTIVPPVVKEYVDVQTYTGEYEVTPSSETQTLDTAGMRMSRAVTINPIPQNYGLITWNGSFLTVS